jgi:hypothetical protein
MKQKLRTDKRRTKQPLEFQSTTPHLPDPTYDRSAVMKAAHREYKYAKMKGWTTGPDATSFASCLRLAHHAHQAYQRRAIFAAQGLRLVA